MFIELNCWHFNERYVVEEMQIHFHLFV